MKKGLSIILPAYKEAENLSELLPEINEILKSVDMPHEILIVDTVQPMDSTYDICRQNNAVYIKREGGDFYGDAIRTGFNISQYEYAVVMDADCSHDPNDIKKFLQVAADNDLVIGSRYTKGGNTDNSFILKLMSYILNCSYRLVFGIKVKDISDSYRLYKTEMVQKLKLECNNFDIVEEILIKLQLHNKNLRIKEVPIVFNKREYGESKRNLKKFIMSYLSTMKHLYDIKLCEQGKENKLSTRILKFGITGGVGTLVNLFIFFILVDNLKINSNIGSCIAFVAAATHNYFVNHTWTFRFQNYEKTSFFQWLKYIGANLTGLACNLIVLNILNHLYIWKYETIPQLAGIIAGLFLNFLLSNQLVFKKL